MAEDVKATLVDKFITHDIELSRFAAGERRRAIGILNKIEDGLAKLVGKLDDGVSQTVRLNRLKKMRILIADIVRTGYTELKATNRSATKGVAKIQQTSVRKFVEQAVGVDLLTLSVPKRLLKAVDKKAVVGAPALDWWGRQGATLRNRFIDEMRLGIIAGESLGPLRQRVRGTKLGGFKDGLMEIPKHQADALIRTSVAGAANEAREAMYKENDDVIRGVQALVTLDERTSDICISRSGGAWNPNTGAPLPDSPVQESYPGPPPWHFNCRTTLVPVLRSIEGIKAKKGPAVKKRLRQLERGTQASMDGTVSGDLDFPQWLQRQGRTAEGRARQRRVLGPGRLALWKSGDINLRQLVDQRGRSLTLAQLRAL
jgi:hypothetical protein